MLKFLIEYCSISSLHGVRYLSERNRHWTEKWWWIIAIGLAMWFCSILIQTVWVKWREDPIKVIMSEKPLPISTIPFPTIIICPETKTHRKKLNLEHLYEVPKEMWNSSDVE